MAQIQIRRNEVPDPALAQRLEREVLEAVALAGPSDGPLACAILDEGLRVEIEFELPGWTETVCVAYPVQVGQVRRAVRRLLGDLGLIDETSAFSLADLSRGY